MEISDKQTRNSSAKLGFWMCVALVMGNMIGSGVFLLPASLAPFGWNAVAGWAVTIAGALCLAQVMAKLTIAYPADGGPIGFAARAFGPAPAFLIGWSYWVSIWTTTSTIAVAAISYLTVFAPTLADHAAVATLALIWIVTAINLIGTRAAAGTQAVTLVLKLLPLVAVIGLIGIVLEQKGGAALAPFPAEGLSLGSVSGAAILTLWALLGFESATVAHDRIDQPGSTIPRATMVGTAATGLIYLIVCSGIALMLPADTLARSGAPFELFVSTYWAHGPALLVAAFAAISAIGALNGWTLMQGEVPAAMARRGLLPQSLASESARAVPARALILSSLIASGFVLLNASKSTVGLFTFLATLSTAATLWLYLCCAAAALKLRIAMPVAICGVAYSLFTLWGAGFGDLFAGIAGRPHGSLLLENSAVLSVALLAASFPVWLRIRRAAATG